MKPLPPVAIIGIMMTIIIILGTFIAVTAPDPDHETYLAIRDTSNCTMQNDTYCTNVSLCIHAYEACQRCMCPDDMGGSVPGICPLGSAGAAINNQSEI